MHLEWNQADLLSPDINVALPALQDLSDQLRCPGQAPDEVDAVLAVVYQRLAAEQNWELQEQLIYVLEQAYFEQKKFTASVAPLKAFLERTKELFAERILEIVYFSQEREHWDIFQQALRSPSLSVQKQAAKVIQRMKKAGQWPVKS